MRPWGYIAMFGLGKKIVEQQLYAVSALQYFNERYTDKMRFLFISHAFDCMAPI